MTCWSATWAITANPGGKPLTNRYQHKADLLVQTRQTLIHDTADGQPHEMSLALAIDMLMPCHWDFPQQPAVGGPCHRRKIALSPAVRLLRSQHPFITSQAQSARGNCCLGRFLRQVGRDLGTRTCCVGLGECTAQKKWLAASLAKTLRLQLHL